MELLSGNEAIAEGAWEAGVTIGVGYPGTPSTETLEALARKTDVYAEWCANEKVALEVALGAAAAGARALVTMKHVGLNVAADPLFTASYTGVNGGLVVLVADDPGMYSSQNEQDSHFYALAAQLPMLDPADSAEALAFTKRAYGLSETFDTPVIVRSSVRVSHTRCPVECAERENRELRSYERDPSKWVMMPAFARGRRHVQLDRREALKAWAETCDLNETFHGSTEIGVICAGAVSQLVRDALPEASMFKLAVTWPLPAERLREFARSVDHCYVVEEASDYLRTLVAALGVPLEAPPHPLPEAGELTPALIREAFDLPTADHHAPVEGLPPRPPALCAGCPHRIVFKELARAKAHVIGDIGCYTLGTLPPLSAMETCVDMGASISMAHGFELALASVDHRPVVAVIGDSTFAHSGLSSLLSTAYNRGGGIVCILDNRTTAMTGRQGNPVNGVTLQQRESHELDLEALLAAVGVDAVYPVDAYDREAIRTALKEAFAHERDRLSVLIVKGPCVLLARERKRPYTVNEKCTACGVCYSLGCPAISKDPTSGTSFIDPTTCIGCGQCAQYCSFGAIVVD